MSNPPANYDISPPGVIRANVPPPSICPPPLQPPGFRPPFHGYPSTSYEKSYYSQDSYQYESYQYRPPNVPPIPPSVNWYPPPPTHYPPRPLAAPENLNYRQSYCPIRREVPPLAIREVVLGPPPVKAFTEKLSTPVAHGGPFKSSNQDDYSHNSSSSRGPSPKRERSSVRHREHSWERDDRVKESTRYREERYREHSEDRRSNIERERDRERRYREHRSRSPSHRRYQSRSPSRYSDREHRLRDKYYERHKERQREKERYREEMREYERKRREYQKYRSPVQIIDAKSASRSSDHDRRHRSPSRSSHGSYRESESRSRTREPSHRDREGSKKPLTDREKILEEYSKNYCRTSEDLIAKMEQWSKEHQSEDDEVDSWISDFSCLDSNDLDFKEENFADWLDDGWKTNEHVARCLVESKPGALETCVKNIPSIIQKQPEKRSSKTTLHAMLLKKEQPDSLEAGYHSKIVSDQLSTKTSEEKSEAKLRKIAESGCQDAESQYERNRIESTKSATVVSNGDRTNCIMDKTLSTKRRCRRGKRGKGRQSKKIQRDAEEAECTVVLTTKQPSIHSMPHPSNFNKQPVRIAGTPNLNTVSIREECSDRWNESSLPNVTTFSSLKAEETSTATVNNGPHDRRSTYLRKLRMTVDSYTKQSTLPNVSTFEAGEATINKGPRGHRNRYRRKLELALEYYRKQSLLSNVPGSISLETEKTSTATINNGPCDH